MTPIFAVTFVMSAVLICKWTLSHSDDNDGYGDQACSITTVRHFGFFLWMCNFQKFMSIYCSPGCLCFIMFRFQLVLSKITLTCYIHAAWYLCISLWNARDYGNGIGTCFVGIDKWMGRMLVKCMRMGLVWKKIIGDGAGMGLIHTRTASTVAYQMFVQSVEWHDTTLCRTSVQVTKPSDATHSARPMGQPSRGHRLPQPGQLTIRDELLGYHSNNNAVIQ